MSQGICPKFIPVHHFLDDKRGMEAAQFAVDLGVVNAFGSCHSDVLRTRQLKICSMPVGSYSIGGEVLSLAYGG